MYKVSILVPIYGVESYIERCARSLFEQTYPNLEYVFVNDCTPDRSVDILKRLIDEYPERKPFVKIINHESNLGIAATRNTALDNVTGEFVSHVDSDDWLEPNAIELLVKRQVETKADIVSGNMYIHGHESVTEFVQPQYDNKEQMVLMQFPPTHDHDIFRRIIRRSLYEENHIRCIEGNDMGEDRYQMVQLCYFAKGVSAIDDFVYHYNSNNSDSYTHQIQKEKQVLLFEQGLNNWLGIRRFLYDKEKVFLQGTTEFTVKIMKALIPLSLKQKNRTLYHRLVKTIYDNEDCMKMIGWESKGVRNRILHNYHYLLVRDHVKKFSRRLQNAAE